jgi:hypothetical protein
MADVRCLLDAPALVAQADRYAAIGKGARLLKHDRRRIVVALAEHASDDAIAELLAVERGCCPFFDLDWRPDTRRLSVSVSDSGDESALAYIAGALGVDHQAAAGRACRK